MHVPKSRHLLQKKWYKQVLQSTDPLQCAGPLLTQLSCWSLSTTVDDSLSQKMGTRLATMVLSYQTHSQGTKMPHYYATTIEALGPVPTLLGRASQLAKTVLHCTGCCIIAHEGVPHKASDPCGATAWTLAECSAPFASRSCLASQYQMAGWRRSLMLLKIFRPSQPHHRSSDRLRSPHHHLRPLPPLPPLQKTPQHLNPKHPTAMSCQPARQV